MERKKVAARLAVSLILQCSLLIGAPAHAADAAGTERLSNIVALRYADIAYGVYVDSVTSAEALQAAIQNLLQHPSAATLSAARTQWTVAHRIYGYTEAFRFFNGPIDDARGLERRINSWPVDAAYLDYTQGDPNSGLINHPENDASAGVTLSAEGLAAINQRESERNVSVGWHAIEFLLWGEDVSPTGAGDRPFTDFVPGAGKNAERRRRTLDAITSLLIADLRTVRDEWNPTAHRFGARFAENPLALRSALIGFSTLAGAELAGERLSTALHTQSQEEEQSCFSDTTTNDINANISSLTLVWSGHYRRLDGIQTSGPGLRDAVIQVDVALARKMDVALNASRRAAQSLHSPFDQEIVIGNALGQARVARLIERLEVIADLGKQAVRALARGERASAVAR